MLRERLELRWRTSKFPLEHAVECRFRRIGNLVRDLADIRHFEDTSIPKPTLVAIVRDTSLEAHRESDENAQRIACAKARLDGREAEAQLARKAALSCVAQDGAKE
jgi:hypothetical protein